MNDVPPGEQQSVLRAWRGWERAPSSGEGMAGLATGRRLFGWPGASRAEETRADFHIVFIMLARVFNIHL